jgi:hypothetical protein
MLPKDVLKHFLTYWLDNKSLVHLHTATCSKPDSCSLDQAFDQLQIAEIMVNDSSLEWFEKRNINVNYATTLYLNGWTKLTLKYLLG